MGMYKPILLLFGLMHKAYQISPCLGLWYRLESIPSYYTGLKKVDCFFFRVSVCLLVVLSVHLSVHIMEQMGHIKIDDFLKKTTSLKTPNMG